MRLTAAHPARHAGSRLEPDRFFVRLHDSTAHRTLGIFPVFALDVTGLEVCARDYVWPGTALTAQLFSEGELAPQCSEGIVRRCVRCGRHGGYLLYVSFTRHLGNSWNWLQNLHRRYRARSMPCPEYAAEFCSECRAGTRRADGDVPGSG